MRDSPSPNSPTADLKIKKRASAKFTGQCCLVEEHPIGKGMKIVLVAPMSSPDGQMYEIGWACARCAEQIARGL